MKSKAKRLLAVFAAALMLLPFVNVHAVETSYDPSAKYLSSVYYRNLKELIFTGNQRLDLINVCLTQVGYHEGNSPSDIDGLNSEGYQDYTEYGRWYGEEMLKTDPFYTPWCAIFVSWAARQARMPEYVVNTSAYAHVGTNPCYFHVPYRSSAIYSPKTGDLIFYDYTGTGTGWSHVGIVLFAEGGVVWTIEGNYNKRVIVMRHATNDKTIRGYGVPDYPAAAAASALDIASYTRPDKTLKKGSTGSQVSWLQTALLRLGYYTPVDGRFASQTERMVKKFQKDHGISETGTVGSTTRAKLLALFPAGYSGANGGSGGTGGNGGAGGTTDYPVPDRTLTRGSMGEDVCWLQSVLSRLGYMNSVTGYYGAMTEAAVKQLQKRLGVIQTGTFGSVTRGRLLTFLGLSGSTPDPTQTPSAPTPTPAAGSGYPVPERTLKKGMQGDDVKWVQAILKSIGYNVGVTGYFGSATQKAVKKFQKACGLTETGKVNSTTRACLAAFAGGGTPSSQPTSTPQPTCGPSDPRSYPVPERVLKKGCTGDDVRWLQAALRAFGMSFNVTGYYGNNTKDGVKWFQRAYGLSQTGICDERTRAYIVNVLKTLGY